VTPRGAEILTDAAARVPRALNHHEGIKETLPGQFARLSESGPGQVKRLLAFMSENGLEEFEYARGDLRIRLKKA